MQKARRSSIQSIRPYKGIPGIPATRHSRHSSHSWHSRHSSHSWHSSLQASLHVPVLPVPSSVSNTSSTFQRFQGFHPITALQHSPIRMQILHIDWFPQKTPSSTNWEHSTNLHSSKKGRCCDIGQKTLRVKLTFSQFRINSSLRLVK